MALMGCSACGLVLEGENDVEEGHLAMRSCPDCGQQLRSVGVAEATQLSRERYLARRWRELAARRRARRDIQPLGEQPPASLG